MSSNSRGGFEGIVRQAQKMQQQIGRLQEQMADTQIEASAGGGAVVAVVNGKQKLVAIQINPEVVDPGDVETLQDLVLSAVNMAMESAQEMMQQEVNKITGGMAIPGLF